MPSSCSGSIVKLRSSVIHIMTAGVYIVTLTYLLIFMLLRENRCNVNKLWCETQQTPPPAAT